MSMPQIPEEKFRPDICEVLIDILKSIALEETALSHILNAEGEKNQLIIKEVHCEKKDSAIDDLVNCINGTEKLLNTILMKEWLLLKKMETVRDVKELLYECKKASCTQSDKKEKKCGSSQETECTNDFWFRF